MVVLNPSLPKRHALVVDDEPLVRMTGEMIVEEAGFTALLAGSADEALELLQTHDDIVVVFSDIQMPGRLNGADLATIVRERWPAIGVVLTSGFMRELPVASSKRTLFIPKPYHQQQIIDAIETVLADEDAD